LYKFDAAHVNRCREARHIAADSAAQRQYQGFTVEPGINGLTADIGNSVDGFMFFSCRENKLGQFNAVATDFFDSGGIQGGDVGIGHQQGAVSCTVIFQDFPGFIQYASLQNYVVGTLPQVYFNRLSFLHFFISVPFKSANTILPEVRFCK
jgi:hypothetical protein